MGNFNKNLTKIFLMLSVLSTILGILHLYHNTGLGSRIKFKVRTHFNFKPSNQEKAMSAPVPKHEHEQISIEDLDQNEKNDRKIQASSTENISGKAKYDRTKSLINERKSSPQNTDKDTNANRTNNALYRHSNAKIITYKDIIFREPDCDRKFLIYVCSTGNKCGGLADRQKGMMSTFLLAVLTGRTLLIRNNYPCSIEEYVWPNLYNWTKCWPQMHKYMNHSQLEIKSYMLGFVWDFSFPKDLERYHGDDLWDEHVVKIHLNTRLLQTMKSNPIVRSKMPWIANIPEEIIIKNAMEILFKNSNKLEKQVSEFFRTYVHGRPLVCGHIRVGQNPSFKGPGRDPVFLNKTDATKLLMSLHKIHITTPGSVLFITSDSNELKLIAKQNIKNITFFNGHIEHIDKIRSETCIGTNTAFVEQQILSKCETLVMTGSGFSRMAAFMGGRAKHIYITKNKKAVDIKEVSIGYLTTMFGPYT